MRYRGWNLAKAEEIEYAVLVEYQRALEEVLSRVSIWPMVVR